MKDGLYQYQHGNVCAAFTVKHNRIVTPMAPIIGKLLVNAHNTFWKRVKWVAPLYENQRRHEGSSPFHRSQKAG